MISLNHFTSFFQDESSFDTVCVRNSQHWSSKTLILTERLWANGLFVKCLLMNEVRMYTTYRLPKYQFIPAQQTHLLLNYSDSCIPNIAQHNPIMNTHVLIRFTATTTYLFYLYVTYNIYIDVICLYYRRYQFHRLGDFEQERLKAILAIPRVEAYFQTMDLDVREGALVSPNGKARAVCSCEVYVLLGGSGFTFNGWGEQGEIELT